MVFVSMKVEYILRSRWLKLFFGFVLHNSDQLMSGKRHIQTLQYDTKRPASGRISTCLFQVLRQIIYTVGIYKKADSSYG